MNKQIVDEALLFYEIDNDDYKEKCYICLNQINNNKKLLIQFENLYKTLFIDLKKDLKDLWNIKSLRDLFNEKTHPFITNLILLKSYKIHKDNFIKFNLDEEQIKKHKFRVKECLTNDIFIRKYDGIRISQMLWGSYFINIRIIEIGRLQYEKYEDYIKIHIPSNDKLDIYKVSESLSNSKYYIEKYFDMKEFDYHCNSWLLSKQIHKLVETNSNIYKFYNLFDIEEGDNCIDDILNFVYQITNIDDYKNLKENTSLQRKVKDYLLKGNVIKIGKGVLKRGEKVNE